MVWAAISIPEIIKRFSLSTLSRMAFGLTQLIKLVLTALLLGINAAGE
jgi:hypothetical protein